MKYLISVFTLVLLTCSMASAPIDMTIIPPIDFQSDHQWIEVPSKATDQQLKQLIRTEVIRLIDQNKQPISYEKAINVFQDWMKEKQKLDDLWNKRMLELGTQLRHHITEVNNLRQENISLENQIDTKRSLLESLQPTLKNDSLALDRIRNEKESLKRNLESQLMEISYLVVVLGKQQLGVIDNLSAVRDIIAGKMMMEAIRDVNENHIMTETTILNNQIIRDKAEAAESGHAQVLDTYTNDFAKLSGGRDVRYLVQAIEVSPFKSTNKEAEPLKQASTETTVNIITQRNINQIWRDNKLTDDPTKIPIKDFILRLCNQAEKHNRGNDAKIRKLNSTYQERLTEVNSKIAAVENDLLVHGNQLMQTQIDIAALTHQYDQLTVNPAVENLKNVYEAYRNHYNLRVILADKAEEGFLKKSREDEYSNIASSTVDKMKEFTEGEYVNTMIVVNSRLDSYSENLLSYSPIIRAFTILYLSRKNLSTGDKYAACIGYQIAWEPIATPTSTISTGGIIHTIHGPLPNMEFINIRSGSFLMGSPEDESGRDSVENPQHQVAVQSFNIMTTEVTQAHWKSVMGSNPSYFTGDNLPAENISWNDCQQFIIKLNQMDPGKMYRLPTEAEWEYACRAGTSTRFFSGDRDLDLKKVGWFGENSNSRTHPVGTKEPDVWGLHDMHGNVWEWCEDWFYHSYKGAPTDGTAWVTGYSTNRILRGGSWGDHSDDCRSANRDSAGPDDSSSNIGFRLVYKP